MGVNLGEYAQAFLAQMRQQHLHALAIEVELVGSRPLPRLVEFINAIGAATEPEHCPFVTDTSACLQSLNGRRHHRSSDLNPAHPTALFQPRHSCSRIPSRSIPDFPR